MTSFVGRLPKSALHSIAVQLGMIAAVAGVTAAPAMATTISGTSIQTIVDDAGTNLTFPQFNPALGTLTGMNLTIYSSTLSGSVTLARTSGSRTYSDFTAQLSIDPAAGFGGYDASALSFARSPSGSITMNASNPTQLITVTGTSQSLIGGSPVSLSNFTAPYTAYIGTGSVAFTAYLLYGDQNTGNGTTTATPYLAAETTAVLTYTYTNPDPVPEIDPAGAGSALVFLAGSLGLLERRRDRGGKRR